MTHRNEIPTATPIFSGSRKSMVILRILLDETGSGNFKMAAAEPHVPITQVLDKVATKFQRVTHIFVVRQLNGTKPDIAQCKRKTLIQNGDRQTGSKPEVLISQLLDKIATPFQRLHPHFRSPATQWHYCRYCQM